jgi:hypothetical protein
MDAAVRPDKAASRALPVIQSSGNDVDQGGARSMQARRLGWTDLEVSPLGLGCGAIGGPTQFGGSQFGWGQIDQSEAVRAIHVALDGRITFLDTADIYGTGQSERIVGQALAARLRRCPGGWKGAARPRSV